MIGWAWPTRSSLALAAAGLAAIAGVVANQEGEAGIVPFFLVLTLGAGVLAWAVHEPFVRPRSILARTLAVAWVGAAIWIAGLLLVYQATCGCSEPYRPPERLYLGLPATLYHLAGLYLGGALAAVAAFSRRLSAG